MPGACVPCGEMSGAEKGAGTSVACPLAAVYAMCQIVHIESARPAAAAPRYHALGWKSAGSPLVGSSAACAFCHATKPRHAAGRGMKPHEPGMGERNGGVGGSAQPWPTKHAWRSSGCSVTPATSRRPPYVRRCASRWR